MRSSSGSTMCSRSLGRTPSLASQRRAPLSRNVSANVAQPQLWTTYCKNLEERPVVTKSLTSLVGFMLGDCLAQDFEGATSLDTLRVVRLGLYGLIFDGPFGHTWYRWLDGKTDAAFDNPRGAAAVAIKTAADQIVWAPVMTCVFFAFLKLLEGHPELMLPTIQDKVLKTVIANYCVWPAAHIISFKYVPSEQRVLYNNVIAIAWNCYLSLVAQDAAPEPDGPGLQALADLFKQETLAANVEQSLRVLKTTGALAPEQVDDLARAVTSGILQASSAVDDAREAIDDLFPADEIAAQIDAFGRSLQDALPGEVRSGLGAISESVRLSMPEGVTLVPTRTIVR